MMSSVRTWPGLAAAVCVAAWAATVDVVLHAQAQAPALAASQAADEAKIWSGVYTDAQASRGKSIYEAYCTRCHGLNLLGGRQGGVGGPGLKDTNFWVSWERAPLSALFGKIERTMPLDSPASLRQDDYTDVLAFILKENAFPAGKTDLPATGLDGIRIARRAGEASEVPDFSLVQVVGCLTTGSDGRWLLTGASAPALTREEIPSAASLAAAAKQSPGSEQLALIGARPFKPEANVGRRVDARGLLSRGPKDGSRLDVLSLQSLGSSCSQ